MADQNIKFVVTVDNTGAIKGIQQVGTELDKTKSKGKESTNLLQQGWVKFTAAISVATMAVQKVWSIISGFDKAAQEAELSQLKLANALKTTNSELDKKSLIEYADNLEKLTKIDADEILTDVTANLVTFTNVTKEQFPRAQQAIMDFAAFMGTDLKNATIMIGNALENPVENLGKLGKAFTKSEEEMIKSLYSHGKQGEALDLILSRLEKRYAGQAEILGKVKGGLGDLALGWDKLSESLGKNEKIQNLLSGVGGMLGEIGKALTDMPSDKLVEEKLNFNAIANSIINVNTTSEVRLELIKQLKKEYPDILSYMTAEEVTIKNVADALVKYNDMTEKRLKNMLLEEEYSSINDDISESIKKRAQISRIATKEFIEIYGEEAASGKSVEEMLTKLAGTSDDYYAMLIYYLSLEKKYNGLLEERIRLEKELDKIGVSKVKGLRGMGDFNFLTAEEKAYEEYVKKQLANFKNINDAIIMQNRFVQEHPIEAAKLGFKYQLIDKAELKKQTESFKKILTKESEKLVVSFTKPLEEIDLTEFNKNLNKQIDDLSFDNMVKKSNDAWEEIQNKTQSVSDLFSNIFVQNMIEGENAVKAWGDAMVQALLSIISTLSANALTLFMLSLLMPETFAAASLKKGGFMTMLGDLMGLQHGGSFEVPGVGAPDSKVVSFAASPGERVTVETPQQQRAGTGKNTDKLLKELIAVTAGKNLKIKGSDIYTVNENQRKYKLSKR